MSSLPSNFNIPFVGVTFDNTPTEPSSTSLDFQALLVGTKLATGTMLTNKLYTVANADAVALLAGTSSQLHLLAIEWFLINSSSVLKIIGLEETASSTASVVSVALTGTATKTGTYRLYINHIYYVEVAVDVGDTATDIAASIATAVNALEIAPCSANASSGTITLTSLTKGFDAGKMVVFSEYNDTDIKIDGIETVISAVDGVGVPIISDMLTAIKNDWFQIIVSPFSDEQTLLAEKIEMASRFDPLRSMDGMLFFGYNDTQANTIAFATNTNKNSGSICCVDSEHYSKPQHAVATAYAAACMASIENDIGQPVHNITLPSISAPIKEQQKTILELNALASNGVACLNPRNSGGASTYGTVTMYLKNTSGFSDTSYQQLTKMFLMMYCRYDFVANVKSVFPRARLAKVIGNMRSDIQVLTEANAVSFAIQVARAWDIEGYIDDFDTFKAGVTATISSDNDKQMVWYLPTDFISQFVDGRATMKTDK